MKTVFILLLIALVAATTCLATPARLSGVRNINNGIALLPTLNLAGRAAAAVNHISFEPAGNFTDGLSDFNHLHTVLESP